MTIESTLHCLKVMVEEENCENCPCYGETGTDHCEKDAVRMAIASLEAWEKVKAEIEELEKSYGFDKATKYGNKDEKQMDLSYSTMYMYEIAGTVDEIKEIINKHLQEIKNG